MKKFFCLFSSLILFNIGFSQINLDSLWNIWENGKNHDTVRLEAMTIFLHGGLNREFRGNDLFQKNPDSAHVLITRMNALAKTSGYERYELQAIRLNGAYFQTIKNFPKAIEFYVQSLEIAKKSNDSKLIILSLVTLGNGYNNWGMTIQADSSKIILAEAEKHFLEALNLIKLNSINNSDVPVNSNPQLLGYEAVALSGLGLNYFFQANFVVAIDHFERSLDLFEKAEDDEGALVAISMLGSIHGTQENYPISRKYFEQQILQAGRSGNELYLEDGMARLGWVLQAERNFPAAIKYFTKSLQLANEKEDKHWIGHNLQSLGDLYTEVGELFKAEDYLTRALIAMREAGPQHKAEQLNMLAGLHNIYIEQKAYSQALENDSIFLVLAKELTPSLVALGLEMFSEDYYEMGEYEKALEYGFDGLKAHEEIGPDLYNTRGIGIELSLLIGKSYYKQGLYTNAVIWCEKADNGQYIQIQKKACECLYESHKALKNGNRALAFHEKYLQLSDSLNTEELAKNLQQMEFSKQLLTDSIAQIEKDRLIEEAHQEEVLAKEKQRNIFLGSGLLVLLLSGGLWSRLRYIRKSKATLQVEKDRSENLLLNILPAEVAAELKANGKAQARDFEMVSILFTDFKEFTQTSEKLSAAELVGEINHCFEGFDAIMEKYGVEKIKTIGDAYMAAGGLPVATPESPMHTVHAALEMCEFVARRKVEREAEGKIGFEMRCGIHTGPVVAGIVGVKKFQYDIWGDTVNTASRMETNSEVGKVNISQDTYALVKNEAGFSFVKRGEVAVKGKGKMDMYFVARISS